jgi:hypothetical protein
MSNKQRAIASQLVIDVDDDGGKENVCPPSIKKKHRTTVAGTDFINMFTSDLVNQG